MFGEAGSFNASTVELMAAPGMNTETRDNLRLGKNKGRRLGGKDADREKQKRKTKSKNNRKRNKSIIAINKIAIQTFSKSRPRKQWPTVVPSLMQIACLVLESSQR